MKVAFVIMGQPCSKSNRSQIVTVKRNGVPCPSIIKSKEARAYVDSARLQIPHGARVMLEGDLRVSMRIYYATNIPDLDESLILDALQAEFTKTDAGGDRNLIRAGVYKNDRQVREKHIFHAIDKHNPRAEIEVEQLAGAAASLFEPAQMPIPVFVPPPKRTQRPPKPSFVAPAIAPGADPF